MRLNTDPQTPPDKKLELPGQMEEIRQRQKTIGKMLDWLKIQKEDLIIKAPISGTVTNMDVKKNLLNHPVTRGVPLMEIADTGRRKPWRLELDMPEKRMGHVIDHQKYIRERDPTAQLDIVFTLASNPNDNYYGKVQVIHDRFEVLGEAGGGNTVRIKGTIIDQESLPDELRPGTSCKAKIKCGKKALGYTLFHEAIAFFQRQVLFRFF